MFGGRKHSVRKHSVRKRFVGAPNKRIELDGDYNELNMNEKLMNTKFARQRMRL